MKIDTWWVSQDERIFGINLNIIWLDTVIILYQHYGNRGEGGGYHMSKKRKLVSNEDFIKRN